MANKETKAERREAARRARLEAQRRAQARARRRKMWAGLIGLLAIGGIVAAVLLSGRADRAAQQELESFAAPSGCEVPKQFPEEGASHDGIELTSQVDYKTEPPTSGNHFAQWSDTGIHTQPIPSVQQVHNLEHGHIGIQYSDALSNEIVAALEEVVRANDQWAFLAPRTELDVPLAFTAWTWLSKCATPGSPDDVKAFAQKFIEVRKDQGRESVPGDPR